MIFPHVLVHFSVKQNHKVGGVRCHPHFTKEKWSHGKLPKQNGTLSIAPRSISSTETANIYIMKKSQNSKPLPPVSWVWAVDHHAVLALDEAASPWTHSTGIHALQTERLSAHVETTLKWLFFRITEKPFVRVIKISTGRFYPSPTSHYSLLLLPIALHFRIHG